MNELYYPLIFIGLLVPIVLGVLFVLSSFGRPEGRLRSFKARYTPDVWTPEQMDYALQVFERIWLQYYPRKRRKVKRILNSVNIFWSAKRWRRDGVIAAAETLSSNRLKVWRGPKLRRDRYRMNYTALPEGLVQLLVFNLDGKVLNSNTIAKEYQNLISDVKTELEGQVSHATFFQSYKKDSR